MPDKMSFVKLRSFSCRFRQQNSFRLYAPKNEPPRGRLRGISEELLNGSFFEAEYPTLLRSKTSLRFVFELRRVLLSPSSPQQAAGYSAK